MFSVTLKTNTLVNMEDDYLDYDSSFETVYSHYINHCHHYGNGFSFLYHIHSPVAKRFLDLGREMRWKYGRLMRE